MKKVTLSHMTWPEVREAAKANPTILIPVGSTETQNLHNPTGYDYLVAQRLAEEAAERCHALVTPVMPFGYSDIFIGFPGTITFRPETLQAVFEDIARSLIRTGFDHLLFINNHEPNHALLGDALSRIREEFGIVCASVWPTTLARNFAQDIFEKPAEVLVHGNEPSTSLLSYLYPEMMRMDLAQDAEPPAEFNGFPLASPTTLAHEGQRVPIFLRVADAAPQGGWGHPRGDAEKGRLMFDRMVDFIATFVGKYNQISTRVSGS